MKGPDVFQKIPLRYGQEVTVTRTDGGRETGRAMLQPILGKTSVQEQKIPTALGIKETDRFLYLGEAGLSLDETAYVSCQGRDYVIRQAHPVLVGETCTHWWGILLRREEGAV